MDNAAVKHKELFGHPVGLYILFFTEMWERFSFYGMKALLLFYLTRYHLFSDSDGYLLLGSYAALVYAMPVLGGHIADKYIGFRKAIIFGAVLLVLGHVGMAYEGNQASLVAGVVRRDTVALQVFYFSLALIVMGVGFLKSNISSIVGELYTENDPRRDSGFTIFYMGINMGALLATIICVYLGEEYGWGYGFGAAGIGMFLGLLVFVFGKPYLEGKGEPLNPEIINTKKFGLKIEYWIYISAVLGTFVVWQMVQSHSVVQVILMVAGAGSLAYIIYYAVKFLDKVARERLIALTILILFTIVFWALYEQAYMSLNLFAERVIDLNVLGFELKPGWFLGLNAFFIITLAIPFARLWVWLDKKKLNPSTSYKFAYALILVGLGFGALVIGGKLSGDAGKVASYWLVLAYLLHTCGELSLSPIGLSVVTKMSPTKIVGFMMGVWFLATASSEFIAAKISDMASVGLEDRGNFIASKAGYITLYEYLFYAGIASGLILIVLTPSIKKLMHGIK
ncbi:peptide MFS transporter [Gelidibacter sp.]|uniref:peptide MFS transporter n=1 Tax=Gelidibacter sp. TaxID=2018083 RepID=UPI002CFC48BB|nr:peptide MFS transporter [Gelidibacter sp.]HUH29718.1 peptide MFS transporter [Gelidibacter sp.]